MIYLLLHTVPHLVSEFPTDSQQTLSLLPGLGITHLLSISPAETTPAIAPVADHHHISIDDSVESMLLALPGICAYIRGALHSGGMVLVYSAVESRACVAACAYCKSFVVHFVRNSLM